MEKLIFDARLTDQAVDETTTEEDLCRYAADAGVKSLSWPLSTKLSQICSDIVTQLRREPLPPSSCRLWLKFTGDDAFALWWPHKSAMVLKDALPPNVVIDSLKPTALVQILPTLPKPDGDLGAPPVFTESNDSIAPSLSATVRILPQPRQAAAQAPQANSESLPVASGADVDAVKPVASEPSLSQWRRELSPDDKLDVFDSSFGEWREGAVVSVSATSNDIVVRFRGTVGSRIVTSRAAGNDREDGKPTHGEIAPAYSQVADWRPRLQCGMEFEVLVSARSNFYYCRENDTLLQYVPANHRFEGRWWLSRREWNGEMAVETDVEGVRGYFRSGPCDETACPPASRAPDTTTEKTAHVWELWNGSRWEYSCMVVLTVDNDGPSPVVTVSIDPDLVHFRNIQEDDWPHMLAGAWEQFTESACAVALC